MDMYNAVKRISFSMASYSVNNMSAPAGGAYIFNQEVTYALYWSRFGNVIG